MTSPWDGYDEDAVWAGDHIYAGPHEVIEDLILLTEVCVSFEYWADDFRYWDRMLSPADWEETSPFSELRSVQIANTDAEL